MQVKIQKKIIKCGKKLLATSMLVNSLWSMKMKNKISLSILDGKEDMQAHITNQAFLFAQMTLAEAKKNSLTREQIIKESEHKK
ncbi:hypothetical protein ACQ38_gp14 [Proteus phage PM 93]|uniref:Uncharacterized protein n=1 Tax=Proteus phage PM 93 TaxID=1560284 RepID=A0A0U2YPS6_9CAUD|nr:hypothetical protein ACQ38_gp14 [Proteus phage PM 93]ALS88296.1 hypothetical protein PM93_0014 [Proteus phage PM 93]